MSQQPPIFSRSIFFRDITTQLYIDNMYLDISMQMTTFSFYLLSTVQTHKSMIYPLWIAVNNTITIMFVSQFEPCGQQYLISLLIQLKYGNVTNTLVKETILCLTWYQSSLAIDIDGCAKWQFGNFKSLLTILKFLAICHESFLDFSSETQDVNISTYSTNQQKTFAKIPHFLKKNLGSI